MGMFNADRVGNLHITEVRRDHTGKISKVYSGSKGRWILMTMFPSTAQAVIRKMFDKK